MNNDTHTIQDHLPLTEATFFILLSLAHNPKHGYAIMKDVEDLSGGRIKFSTGTLYGALGRLLDQRWIEQFEPDEPQDTGRPRKDYALTDIGRRILSAEVSRLQGLLATVKLRFGESL
ncbi:MAG: PadR family transcriptional regulator [Anaerolineae bacterium]